MYVDAPSNAALLLPLSPSAAYERLHTALAKERYQSHPSPLPSGYRPSAVEFLSWRFEALSPFGREGIPNTALVLGQPGRIFHVATALSKHHPDLALCAWRHLQGASPTLKFYWGGKPRWREGEDADHELSWELPTQLPSAEPLPFLGFHTNGELLNPSFYRLSPLTRFSAQPNERAFLSRSSMLA